MFLHWIEIGLLNPAERHLELEGLVASLDFELHHIARLVLGEDGHPGLDGVDVGAVPLGNAVAGAQRDALVEDARALLLAGADKVAVNSAAVTRPELVREIAEKFGSQCVVASVDARASTSGAARGWEIFTHGGRKPTGIDAVEHAVRLAELGAGELLVTSMDGDGTKNGYDVELTRAIADSVSVPVIASGGVGTLDHLVEGVTRGNASAVLAASIFHFGEHTIAEAHAALRAAGLPARG